MGKTILIVTHLVPFPPARGVEFRILNLMRWLTSAGYRVVLVTGADSIDEESLYELRKAAWKVYWLKPALRTRLGARLPTLRIIWKALKPLLQTPLPTDVEAQSQLLTAQLGDANFKRALCPDALVTLAGKVARRHKAAAVIAEYIFLAPAFAKLPAGTLKLIDTIDVFSQKEGQVLAYGIADPQACTVEEEREYLLKADVIMAIQSREVGLLKSIVPERQVTLAPMDFVATKYNEEEIDPDLIAVIGSDNALNVHGLRAFLSECWPLIKNANPSAKLTVAGKVGNRCQVNDPSIQFRGWVDDLSEIYRKARVIINPTIAGTGLKIKSAQALAHGKPLVAWPNGVQGLDYVGAAPYCECGSWREFADAVCRLLASDEQAAALANRAFEYASERFNVDSSYRSLYELLETRLNATKGRSDVRGTENIQDFVSA